MQSVFSKISTFSRSYYNYLRSRRYIGIFVILTRCLIGIGFIPSGMKKVLNLRFTTISTDHPVGFFFEAMYQTGFYWQFIGWAQVISAFLLMSQRFSTAGAVAFFPIILNICLITVSMQFKGTWLITVLMLLATSMLLVWDFDKLKHILHPGNLTEKSEIFIFPAQNKLWEIAGILLFINTLLLSELFTERFSRPMLITWAAVEFSIPLGAFILDEIHYRRKLKAGN